MEIEAKVKLLGKDVGLKGVAEITFDKSFIVKGVFIRESEKGLFLSFPSYKSGNEYKAHCHPITAECRQAVMNTVFAAYEQKLSEEQTKGQSHDKKGQNKASGGKTKDNVDTKKPKNSATAKKQEAEMNMEM